MDLQSRRNLICGQSNNNNCVKDKDNLVSHNVWTCGDYSHDLTGFTTQDNTDNYFTEVDNTHPTNGEYNIKLTRIVSGGHYYNIQYYHDISSENQGKTVTLTADIASNLNGRASILLGGTNDKNRTYIPSNSQSRFSVSYIIPSNLSRLECTIATFSSTVTGTIYIDNIQLKIQ